jgi:vacuolar-type H+-ATPase subunit E/Vma4
MKAFSIFMLILCMVSQSHADDGNKEAALMKHLISYEAHYLAVSQTLGEYLEQNERLGIISHEARQSILDFLKNKKVNVAMPVPQPKVTATDITIGSVKLTFQPNGDLKTANGTILKPTKRSVDQVFKDVYEALAHTKSASRLSFISEAYASSDLEDGYAWHSAVVATTFWQKVELTLIEGAGSVICRGTVVPYEEIKYEVKRAMISGTVKCSGSGYIVGDSNIPPFRDIFRADQNGFYEYYKQNFPPSSFSSSLDSAFAANCLLPLMRPDYGPEGKSSRHDLILAATGDGNAQCTDENANKVQKYIRDQAKEENKKIEQATRERIEPLKVDAMGNATGITH